MAKRRRNNKVKGSEIQGALTRVLKDKTRRPSLQGGSSENPDEIMSDLLETPHPQPTPTPLAASQDRQPPSPEDDSNSELRLRPASGRATTALAKVLHGRIIKTWPPGTHRESSRGLRNESQWCYRNSIYQGLLHCGEFVNFLNSCSEQCRAGPDSCSVCAIRRLSFAYWAKGQFFTTKLKGLNNQLDQVLQRKAGAQEWEKVTRQQDAGEFLGHLLSSLEDDSAGHAGAPSLRHALFRSYFEGARVCLDCNTTLGTFSEASDTVILTSSVALNDIVRLDPCLMDFFEERESHRACSNPGCPSLSSTSDRQRRGIVARKELRMSPEILNLVLPVQTMTTDGSGGVITQKRTKGFVYPEHLDLQQFSQHGTLLRYTLQAVIAHIGPSIDSGHYITAVKEPDGTVSTASDLTVYRCTREGVKIRRLLSPVNPHGITTRTRPSPAEAYILMYTKDEAPSY